MSDLLIRRFVAADKEKVWSLHNRALEGTGAHVGNGAWDADVRDPQGSYLNDGGEFLVATISNEIVGMGAYRPVSPDTVEIKRMRVEPSLQGHGIGKGVLVALEAEAVRNGFTVAILETTVQQEAAQNLYEKHGYGSTHQSELGAFEVLHYRKLLT